MQSEANTISGVMQEIMAFQVASLRESCGCFHPANMV